ncbi:MAG TPA: hypothetical protein VGF55_16055 [Gemmataceae bacterium]|jgi:hypothetical protein
METFGFAAFAAVFMCVAWWLTRLMSATGRNDDTTHGGGAGGGGLGI